MSNKTYLVKLTPGSFFFFGGENTLGADAGRNYLVKSNYFPQQTGVLGLLRYCLLHQEELLKDPNNAKNLDAKATALIGDHSFDPGNSGAYGIIEKLSPVFLMDAKGQKLLPTALNAKMSVKQTTNSNSSIGPTVGAAHLLLDSKGKPYDGKTELEEGLVGEDGKLLKFDDVFTKHEQIGIQKDFKGAEQDAFYKQTSWYLEKGWCFACYVKLNQAGAASPLPNDFWVATGGERSMFRFDTVAVEGNFEDHVNFTLPKAALPTDGLEKLVLLSDAYLPNGIYQHCAFAITNTTTFRYLRTDAKTSRYFDLERDPIATLVEKPARSQRFTLLKKGSVLYAKPNQSKLLMDELENQAAFRNIGYNYFLKVS